MRIRSAKALAASWGKAAVYGGGFHHADKFAVRPPELPAQLHWFYWKSYSAWRLEFALFTVFYLLSADTYLVGKLLLNWSLPPPPRSWHRSMHLTWSHPHNWLVLMLLAGTAIRQFFYAAARLQAGS